MNSASTPTPPSRASRRTFLKQSATVSAAAALGTLSRAVPSPAVGRRARRHDRLRRPGLGAAVQALTADTGARLVAMCDIFMDRVKAQTGRDQKGAPGAGAVWTTIIVLPGFDGYKHVIESSDVVLIANAAKFHPFHTMAAIQAGKHVFTEKPHGIDPAGDQAHESGLRPGEGKEAERRLGFA